MGVIKGTMHSLISSDLSVFMGSGWILLCTLQWHCGPRRWFVVDWLHRELPCLRPSHLISLDFWRTCALRPRVTSSLSVAKVACSFRFGSEACGSRTLIRRGLNVGETNCLPSFCSLPPSPTSPFCSLGLLRGLGSVFLSIAQSSANDFL